MRDYAKVGGRQGKPGYRTPSVFRSKVLSVVGRIPKGKTMTYAQVAKLAGSPRAARAVGSVLKGNHDPDIPCHRVIRSDGKAGGYNRGSELKKAILEKEGAIIQGDNFFRIKKLK